ncbi:MAG: DUF899 domain-containing protein [Sneathiella sp.]|nr:DUF899 domain-containing protein [Sneathiella sp.]
MKPQNVVTDEQWLEARKELLLKEKALTKELDKLAQSRRELPWVKIEKDYVFDTENGQKSLSELFEDQSQLIVYHFMFGADWKEGCPSCSFWADNVNGLDGHMKARDISFITVSNAPLEKLLPFKKRMGWDFNWVSSHSNSFNIDFNVSFGSNRKTDDLVTYNFKDNVYFPSDEAPGVSVFAKDDDGNLYRTYSTYGRGLDAINCAYSYIDLTPNGRNEDPANTMSWLHHHDRY